MGRFGDDMGFVDGDVFGVCALQGFHSAWPCAGYQIAWWNIAYATCKSEDFISNLPASRRACAELGDLSWEFHTEECQWPRGRRIVALALHDVHPIYSKCFYLHMMCVFRLVQCRFDEVISCLDENLHWPHGGCWRLSQIEVLGWAFTVLYQNGTHFCLW